jgi:hypothetical protein
MPNPIQGRTDPGAAGKVCERSGCGKPAAWCSGYIDGHTLCFDHATEWCNRPPRLTIYSFSPAKWAQELDRFIQG